MELLYDEDCGVCRSIVGALLVWDRDRRLQPVSIQSQEGQRLLTSVPTARRLDSWHLVEDGRVRSAGAAFPTLFDALPAGMPLRALTQALPGPTRHAYRLVAGNRSRISKLVPTAARDRADRLIARRM